MYKVFLFGGTTEGDRVAACLGKLRIPAAVFTATEYGGRLAREIPEVAESDTVSVFSHRMDADEMADFFRKNGSSGSIVIDATHPYADIVTQNIREACGRTGLRRFRVLRDETGNPAGAADVRAVASAKQAAEYLCGIEGNILVTTGSKELSVFSVIPDYTHRVFARVLPLSSVVKKCEDLGFSGRNLICMQGPFSEEMNIALIHQVDASCLVTKDTGIEGGFPEKLSAAEKCGIKSVVITRPDGDEDGISVEECLKMLKESV